MKTARLLKPNDMKQMPWKNGGGVSLEVAISPPGAQVTLPDFDWRVSIARVDSDGRFSEFPGYDRQLVVWSGEGLSINGDVHSQMKPFAFKGETPIEAKLVSDPVKDFGVIFKRGVFTSEMSVHQLLVDKSIEIDPQGRETFILCTRGEIQIDGFYLHSGDVFQTSDAEVFQAKALERSELVRVTLSRI